LATQVSLAFALSLAAAARRGIGKTKEKLQPFVQGAVLADATPVKTAQQLIDWIAFLQPCAPFFQKQKTKEETP
jgi:hypothetical protein